MNAGAELLHGLSGGKRDRKLSMRAVEAQTNAKEIDDSVFNSRLGKKKKVDDQEYEEDEEDEPGVQPKQQRKEPPPKPKAPADPILELVAGDAIEVSSSGRARSSGALARW